MILPEATLEIVRRRAEDIQAAIKRLDLEFRDVPLGRITASFGVAVFPDNADGPDSMLRAADEALYTAKNEGRDRIVVSSARPLPPNTLGGAICI